VCSSVLGVFFFFLGQKVIIDAEKALVLKEHYMVLICDNDYSYLHLHGLQGILSPKHTLTASSQD